MCPEPTIIGPSCFLGNIKFKLGFGKIGFFLVLIRYGVYFLFWGQAATSAQDGLNPWGQELALA